MAGATVNTHSLTRSEPCSSVQTVCVSECLCVALSRLSLNSFEGPSGPFNHHFWPAVIALPGPLYPPSIRLEVVQTQHNTTGAHSHTVNPSSFRSVSFLSFSFSYSLPLLSPRETSSSKDLHDVGRPSFFFESGSASVKPSRFPIICLYSPPPPLPLFCVCVCVHYSLYASFFSSSLTRHRLSCSRDELFSSAHYRHHQTRLRFFLLYVYVLGFFPSDS